MHQITVTQQRYEMDIRRPYMHVYKEPMGSVYIELRRFQPFFLLRFLLKLIDSTSPEVKCRNLYNAYIRLRRVSVHDGRL